MIRTVEEFNAKKAVCTANLEAKISGSDGRRHIVLCGGTGCLSSHSDEIKERFEEVLKERGLEDRATVNQVGCFGFCSQGPFVKIYPEDTLYRLVKITDVEEIVESDIVNNTVVERLLYVDPVTKAKVSKQDEINFYKKQRRIALHGCGVINPEDINEALGMGAYEGLRTALTMTRQEVVDEVTKSRTIQLNPISTSDLSTRSRAQYGKAFRNVISTSKGLPTNGNYIFKVYAYLINGDQVTLSNPVYVCLHDVAVKDLVGKQDSP